ncbi:acyl carrier protein [Clostridium botulinum]|uniref:acyl carrier protein n=2 Tax=Clostridium TaxID=1485 RepID=UPI000500876D|nr:MULTISPECIES: acyl carrier protein [unclassified Clostridium]AIY78622.1 putative phosphopantetheine attachment site [Clostridium botulinum 202F]KAI3347513.1 acyl carrier protein [Clostridium botulinum]KFX56732.1 acyl carrier protein [Clostridium botulinum]KFX59690.1 acyl carrier protein [Clostridium botulinum]KON14272.1 acyl carrier protein [Clostridium botulinum]
MERIIKVLESVRDDVDFKTCTTLIEGEVLDSFDVIEIVTALDDEYDIEIPASEIVPENFNSAEGILNMVNRLIEE